MSFLSPWFLLGLLGVAIPLAIHMSRRHKAEKLVFSTIRFLKRTPRKVILFQRFKQWLLMLMRAAIIALLAFAFARPFLSPAVSNRAGISHHSAVILMDTSMSMQYGDTFDRAKKAVLELLDSLQTGDEAALITFSDGPGQVKELTTDLVQLMAFVRDLDSAGFNSTGFLAALRLADLTLRSARYPDRTVYLVSDYQRRAADNLGTRWRLSPGVKFEGIKIGEEETTNLAVTEVITPVRLIREREEEIILGRVRNLGTRPLTETRVTLKINGKTVETQNVDLSNETGAVVKFRTKFRRQGIHQGELMVEDEFFAPDNTFFFTVNVPRPLAVLGIVDDSADNPQTGEIRWFGFALGNQGSSPFLFDQVRPDEITGDLLQRYRVVVLLNVREIASAPLEAITNYMEQGGSLLIAPGDRVAANTFNRLFDSLAPASLDQKQIAANGNYLSITGINRQHPIIKAIGLSESGDFGGVRFHGHWSTKPAEDSEVILRFDNGDAALLEKRRGKGRVLLFTSTLGSQWNNLTRQGIFVPLVHETLRYLGSHEQMQPAYTVGETVRLVLPAGNAVRVSAPDGVQTILTSVTGDDVFFQAADRPGFYNVRGRDTLDVLAFNVSVEESDLSFVAPEKIGSELVSKVPRLPLKKQAEDDLVAARTEKSQRLWWWIILFVLFLVLGETLLANRTYR